MNKICKHENCLVSALFGLRNGLKFGIQIRFLHSMGYALVFRRD